VRHKRRNRIHAVHRANVQRCRSPIAVDGVFVPIHLVVLVIWRSARATSARVPAVQ
jgi:hypothetical protein